MNSNLGLGIPVNSQGSPNRLPGNVSRPLTKGINVGMPSCNVNNANAHQQQQPQQQQQQQQQQMQQQQQQASMSGAPSANEQVQQRLMMQQRLRMQQQQQQNFENQIFQLLTTLNRKPKRLYQFTEDADAILKKYEQFKPSFEFHIYENNYKICAPANTRLQQHQRTPQGTIDGLILNKNNEILKEFLEYVARGIIPEAIIEVLRDCNVQFYEGCLILQVYDHTNTVDVKQGQQQTSQQRQQQQSPNASTSANVPSQVNQQSVKSETDTGQPQLSTDGSAKTVNPTKEQVSTLKRPRMYRTLLKPNDLTRYYDMLSWADHTRFSDSVYQQLEAELLAITKRNLRLDTHMNPFTHSEKLPDDEFLRPTVDENSISYPHRELCQAENTKGKVGHVELHEELPQHSSAYEQMMMIMNGRTTTTTNATLAASLAKRAEMMGTGGNSGKGTSASGLGSSMSSSNSVAAAAVAAAAVVGSTVNNENNQFSRLKFVEQFRLNKEKKKQQAMNASMMPNGYNQRISMSASLNPQQMKQQTSSAFQNDQGAETGMSTSMATPTNGKRNGAADGEDKSKPKRQRKVSKKATGDANSGPKKRITKKKQAAAAAAAAAANAGGVDHQK
ncbi:HEL201Cp [Eremothecium sinecaudum]|uniref:HEL201Cp n=1 Tax=Eremothecium sinecaudum TaxID=45286 RepID=A0A0X8HTD8_9SACH|nr:HEL201Cp [Eremothecium sinecaudum]AMD21080.1 HEL201Cp [Eremothecium sinecaudum]